MSTLERAAHVVPDTMQTLGGAKRFADMMGRRLTANASDLVDNAALYRETGRTPFVWIGGVGTTRSHHLWDQIQWQRRGVPTYLTDTGNGLRSSEENARELAATIQQAKAETGSEFVHIGTQSKGGTDTLRMLLDHPEVRPHIKGVFFHNPPFDGGVTVNPDKAAGLERLARRFPEGARNALRALPELISGSPHMTGMRARFGELVEELPEQMRLVNITSAYRASLRDGKAGHDNIVPLAAQQFPPFDPRSVKARQLEQYEFEHNHITTHQLEEVVDLVDTRMRELDAGID